MLGDEILSTEDLQRLSIFEIATYIKNIQKNQKLIEINEDNRNLRNHYKDALIKANNVLKSKEEWLFLLKMTFIKTSFYFL